MSNIFHTARNWVSALTEDARGWLSWKIYPEQVFYMEAVKRMAELDENNRCVKALEDSDSACSGWAIETIKIKLVNLEDLFKDLDLEEPPL